MTKEDLIKRSDALALLHDCWWDSIEKADEKMKKLPSIETEPIKHGRWLRTDAYPHRIYCSECYATFIRNDEFLKLNDIPHDYCPNCGAKMDGQNDE